MRKLIIMGCCLILADLVALTARSQQFGGNPPSVKWKQINTDTVRIIFQTGMDSQANRAAAIVHYLANQKPVSLGEQLKKINMGLAAILE